MNSKGIFLIGLFFIFATHFLILKSFFINQRTNLEEVNSSFIEIDRKTYLKNEFEINVKKKMIELITEYSTKKEFIIELSIFLLRLNELRNVQYYKSNSENNVNLVLDKLSEKELSKFISETFDINYSYANNLKPTIVLSIGKQDLENETLAAKIKNSQTVFFPHNYSMVISNANS